MTLEPAVRVATSTVDALKSQPLALALIIINVLFLAAGGWVLHEVATTSRSDRAAQAALLTQMAANCGTLQQVKP